MQDVGQSFANELRTTYGSDPGIDYGSHIECIDSAYKFLRFERIINKKRKEYRDASARENIDKLNAELVDVKNIMSESFDMLLNRDRNLTQLSEMGGKLSEESSKMKSDAKKLRLSYMFRQYMTYIVVAAIFIFLVLIKIYVL